MHTNTDLRLPEKILQVFLCFFSFLCMPGSARIPFLTGSNSVRSLLAGCFVLAAVLLGSYVLSRRLKPKQLYSIRAAVFIALVVYMLAEAYFIRLTPRVDLQSVIDTLRKMLAGNTYILQNQEYYEVNPNNIPLTLLLYWVMRAYTAVFGAEADILLAGGVFNVVMITVTILLLFKIIREFSADPRTEFLTGMVILLNPCWIAYASYYYTDTVSLPFAAGGFLLFLKSLRSEDTGKMIMCAAGSSVLFFAAVKIRVTFILLVLSCLIYVLYRRRWRLLLLLGVVSGVTLILLQSAYVQLYRFQVTFDTYDTALPAEHFMMMGSHGNGASSEEDRNYTRSFPLRAQKVQACLERIYENLKENGIAGNLRLAVVKEMTLWCDGPHGYRQFTEYAVRESVMHEVLNGKYAEWLRGYMQAYNVIVYLLIIRGFCTLMRRNSCCRSSGWPRSCLL